MNMRMNVYRKGKINKTLSFINRNVEMKKKKEKTKRKEESIIYRNNRVKHGFDYWLKLQILNRQYEVFE